MSKQSLADLAIFGGPPLSSQPLMVGRPNIGSKAAFLEYVDGIFERRWLTNHGQLVGEFEARLAEFLGVRHVITVCNGTIALEIAIRALGLSGEVIVPSFTFVATAHALQWQQIKPVFADIDPVTHCLSPDSVRARITPKTSGIVGVHLWGTPCATDELAALADEYGLKLMYDAAHAFGCSQQGKMIGTFGECEVFSFHATKIFNTFEGGAICTNRDDLANTLRLMTNFGFAGFDNVVHLGTNGKMTEICAAMGLSNLDSLGDFVAISRDHHETYTRAFSDISGVRVFRYDKQTASNYQYVIVEIDATRFGMQRDDLYRLLHAENVIARRYFYPGCHRMQPYLELYPNQDAYLPETNALSSRILAFPTGTQMNSSNILKIAELIHFIQVHASAILAKNPPTESIHVK